ncbi:MAG: pseudouridine synthase family protein [Bacteroidetes bacterium]|jgi:23S rRNA pseudouridine2605 synthase|nr:pseudouridine synthase family protein [Bacteroidota bacterium]
MQNNRKKPGAGGKKPFSSSTSRDKGKKGSFKSDRDKGDGKKQYGTERSRKFKEKKFDGSDDTKFEKKDGGKRSYSKDRDYTEKSGGDRKYNKDGRKSSERKEYSSDRKPFKRDSDKGSFGDKKKFSKDRDYSERSGGERKYGKEDGYKKDRKEYSSDRKPFKRDSDKGGFGDKKKFSKDRDFSERSGGERKYGKGDGYKKDRKEYSSDRKPFKRDSDKGFGDKKRFSKDRDFSGKSDFKKESYGKDKERSFTKRSDDAGNDSENFRDREFKGRKKSGRENESESYEKSYYNKDLKYTKGHKDSSSKKTHKESFNTDGLIRLNKYIANAGICSRREADDLIKAGAVSVNGKVVTEMGFKVSPDDKISYGGETLRNERKVYLLLNKPKDYITTMDDPRERRTVMELIKGACKERIYPVGRLDRNTTGLLLFTNDGELATRLMHPKFGIRKIYHVTLGRNVKPEDFAKLMEGIELEDGFIKPDEVSFVGDGRKEIGIEIHSGKNRIVRRIFEHLDYEIVKLDRVAFAGLSKKDLPRGKWRFLTPKEVNFLKMVG